MRKYRSKILSKKCPDCGVLIHVHIEKNKEIECSGCHIVWSVVQTLKGVDLYCKPGKRSRPSCESSLSSWGIVSYTP
jgi:hypothetical protein